MVKLNDTGLFVAKQNGVNYAVSAELLKEYTSPLAKQELGDPYSPGVPGMVMPGDGFTYDETTGLLDVSIPPGIKFIGLIGTDASNGEVLVPDPDLSEAGSFYIVAEDDEFFGVDESDWPGLVGDAYGNVHLNLNDKVVLTELLEWVIIPTISSDAYLGRYGDRVSNAPGNVIYQFNESLTFDSAPSDLNLKAGGNINLDSTNLNGNFTDNVVLDIDGDVFVNQNGTELKIIASGLIQTESQEVTLITNQEGVLIGNNWNVLQDPVEDTHIVNKKYVDEQLYVDPDDCGEYTATSSDPGPDEIRIHNDFSRTRIQGPDEKFQNDRSYDVKVTYSDGSEHTLTKVAGGNISGSDDGTNGTYYYSSYDQTIPLPPDGDLVTFCLIDVNREDIYVTHEEFEVDQDRQDKASLGRDAILELEILALTKQFNEEQARQDDEIEALKQGDCPYATATSELEAYSGQNTGGLFWDSSNSRLFVGHYLHDGWPSPSGTTEISIDGDAYDVVDTGNFGGHMWFYQIDGDISSLVGTTIDVSLCIPPDYITREEFEEDQERQDLKITELQEEIDAIAPVVDSGTWIYNGIQSTADANPTSGKFYLQYKDPNTNNVSVVTTYSQANQIVVHNTDATGNNNTWADVEAGEYVQLYDNNDDGTLVGSLIIPPDDKGGYVVMFIDKINHKEPNPTNDEEVQLKIFQPPTGGGDASQFILRTGDTMEGDLTFEDPNDSGKAVNIVMKNEGELQTTKINSGTMGTLKVYHNNQIKMMYEANDIKLFKDGVYDTGFSKTTDDDSKYIPDTAWVKKVIDFTSYDELTP
jgi:hypothetical protein